MPSIFKCLPKAPTNANPPKQVDKLAQMEEKWGRYRDAAVQRLQSPEGEGWTIVYTDGSSKTVRGWMQGGYGVWFAGESQRKHAAHVPENERQSVSRGELRGALYAILHRRPGECMAAVMDSENVFKAITEWYPKWRRHGWRMSSGEVEHRDLWEKILWERERAGAELQVRWVPSHLGVQGNHEAEALAEMGRQQQQQQQHPHNQQPLPK